MFTLKFCEFWLHSL